MKRAKKVFEDKAGSLTLSVFLCLRAMGAL